MSTSLRLVLAWLLAAALPLQGVAAASMALCETGHGGSAVGHHVVEHVAPAAAGDAVAAHAHGDGHGSAHDHPATSETVTKCSVCASCCAAAVPVQDFAFPSGGPPETFAPARATGVLAFVTERLERPPRLSFA